MTLAFTTQTSIYQILFLLFSNLLSLMYQGSAQPGECLFYNRLDSFNELMVTATTFTMLLFTDWVHSIEFQYTLGWLTISLTLLLTVANLFFFTLSIFRTLKLLYIKYSKRYRYWRGRREREERRRAEEEERA